MPASIKQKANLRQAQAHYYALGRLDQRFGAPAKGSSEIALGFSRDQRNRALDHYCKGAALVSIHDSWKVYEQELWLLADTADGDYTEESYSSEEILDEVEDELARDEEE